MQEIAVYDWNKNKGRKPKYDWDKILDGGIYRMQEGVDFECSRTAFRTLAFTTARKRGLYVRIRFEGENALVLQSSVEPVRSKVKKQDPLYSQVVKYVSHRDKINKNKIMTFFRIGKKRTAKIVDQLIKDGYISEYDPSEGGFPTNLPSKGNVVVSFGKKEENE
jgi:hypothetical protein